MPSVLDRAAIGREPFRTQGLLITANVLERAVELWRRGRATVNSQVRKAGPRPRIRPLFQKRSCEPGGLLVNKRTIEEEKRLERYRRAVAHGHGHTGVRAVENGQVGLRVQALNHQVDATVLSGVHRLELVVGSKAPGRWGREWVRSGPRAVEAAPQVEHCISQCLG
jgi:hypothetical protein